MSEIGLHLCSLHWVEFRMNDETIIYQFPDTSIHLGQEKRKKINSGKWFFQCLLGYFLKNENTYFSIIIAIWILANYNIHTLH